MGLSNDEHLHDVNDDNVKTVEKEESTHSEQLIDGDVQNSNELLKP